MKIIALEKENEGVLSSDFKPHLAAEAAAVWDLHQSGFIREIYFRQDRTDAVLVLEAENISSAREKLNDLPLVKRGLIQFELIPLRAYSGFNRLFKSDVV